MSFFITIIFHIYKYAEGKGFEPSLPFRGDWFSKPAQPTVSAYLPICMRIHTHTLDFLFMAIKSLGFFISIIKSYLRKLRFTSNAIGFCSEGEVGFEPTYTETASWLTANCSDP
jgi:hypothetical protein